MKQVFTLGLASELLLLVGDIFSLNEPCLKIQVTQVGQRQAQANVLVNGKC